MLSDDAKSKIWFYFAFICAFLSVVILVRTIYLFSSGEMRFVASGGVQMTISEPTLKRAHRQWRHLEKRQVVLPRLYPIFSFAGPLFWLIMMIYSIIMFNLYKSSSHSLRQLAYFIWLLGMLLWFGIDFYIRWQAWHR